MTVRTRSVNVGNVKLGADAPVIIQSMTNTDTTDIDSTVKQIQDLTDAGCQIVRLGIPDIKAAEAISKIKERVSIPIVADIHYDYRLAISAIENGADKIRINPGNIGGFENFKKIIKKAKERNVPIRIGVNSGSLEADLLEKYGAPTPEALCESMIRYVKFCEENDFYDLVLSIKTSDVADMIKANQLISEKLDYPLHLGVTEAGFGESAIVKSSIGIGTLLNQGIGDTIRVSLTDNPVEEIGVAREILAALNLKTTEPVINLISCPTCARTQIDLIPIAKEIKEKLKDVKKDLTVAVMGCSVNGPGEAREADIGIAGAGKGAILFKKGEIVKQIDEENIVETLLEEIEEL